MLETCKKKVLKGVALFFLEKPVELDYNKQFHQWYSFALDIIDTKLFKPTNVISPKKKIPKNVCIFVNKGIADTVSKTF